MTVQTKKTTIVDPCFKDLPPNPPVGLWFHSFNDNEFKTVRWQGRVVSKIDDNHYLVLLFEWMVGDVSCLQIVTLDEMRTWEFYDTRDWWHDKWHNDLCYRNERLRRRISNEAKAAAE